MQKVGVTAVELLPVQQFVHERVAVGGVDHDCLGQAGFDLVQARGPLPCLVLVTPQADQNMIRAPVGKQAQIHFVCAVDEG